MRFFFFLFSSSFLGLYQCLIPLGWAASPRLTLATSAQQRPQKKGQAAPRMPTTPPPHAKKGYSPPTPRGWFGAERGHTHSLGHGWPCQAPQSSKIPQKASPSGENHFPTQPGHLKHLVGSPDVPPCTAWPRGALGPFGSGGDFPQGPTPTLPIALVHPTGRQHTVRVATVNPRPLQGWLVVTHSTPMVTPPNGCTHLLPAAGPLFPPPLIWILRNHFCGQSEDVCGGKPSQKLLLQEHHVLTVAVGARPTQTISTDCAKSQNTQEFLLLMALKSFFFFPHPRPCACSGPTAFTHFLTTLPDRLLLHRKGHKFRFVIPAAHGAQLPNCSLLIATAPLSRKRLSADLN